MNATTNTTWYRGVVVGVDGSEESLVALDWAACTADAHDARLTVVSTYATPPEPGPGTSRLVEDGRRQAHDALRVAMDRLDGRRPGNRTVQTVVLPGTASHVLAQLSRSSDLVVVARRRLGAFDRALLGSTSSALAAHTTGTVAVVPEGAAGGAPTRIRMGAGRSEEPELWSAAFTEAVARGCPLEVLHATGSDPITDAALRRGPSAGSWQGVVATAVADRAARWSARYPRVTCTTTNPPGDAVAALLDGLTPDDLVVVGGNSHGTLTGRLLRSVSGTVLRSAPCPVLVVHTHTARQTVSDSDAAPGGATPPPLSGARRPAALTFAPRHAGTWP